MASSAWGATPLQKEDAPTREQSARARKQRWRKGRVRKGHEYDGGEQPPRERCRANRLRRMLGESDEQERREGPEQRRAAGE
eukprot:5585383-Pleurochrysis_carterae.AAC.3